MRTILYCSFMLLLVGCAGKSPVESLPAEDVKADGTRNYKWVLPTTELKPGARIKISDPESEEPKQAIVQQGYISALGQQCYRIIPDGIGAPDENVLCRDENGQWLLVPSVQPLSKGPF